MSIQRNPATTGNAELKPTPIKQVSPEPANEDATPASRSKSVAPTISKPGSEDRAKEETSTTPALHHPVKHAKPGSDKAPTDHAGVSNVQHPTSGKHVKHKAEENRVADSPPATNTVHHLASGKHVKHVGDETPSAEAPTTIPVYHPIPGKAIKYGAGKAGHGAKHPVKHQKSAHPLATQEDAGSPSRLPSTKPSTKSAHVGIVEDHAPIAQGKHKSLHPGMAKRHHSKFDSTHKVKQSRAPTFKSFAERKKTNRVVAAQPKSETSITPTQKALECPPGLEPLKTLEMVILHQETEALEVISGYENNNRFIIVDKAGELLFHALEESDCLTRHCCGNQRPFGMHVMDFENDEIMIFSRPCACDCFGIPWILQSIYVEAPPGERIGSVEQDCIFCLPQFTVKDWMGTKMLKITGPAQTCSCCGSDVVFSVDNLEGKNVGKISKKWGGVVKEFLTDADIFGIQFPLELDVKLKATLVGACMLIDFMYFEHRGGLKL